MTTTGRVRIAFLVAVTVLLSGLYTQLAGPAARADSGDVVISELMYHAPDPEVTEFIELANRGSTPVDLSGWSFSAGITLATPDLRFPSGTTIPAGGRIVGTGDAASFQARYGFAADFSYAGTSLSNGGEQVTLVDGSAAVVDDVTYDDAAPWPVAPDGGGPSLELIDLATDNALAAGWAPSTTPFGTPGQVNTVELNPPLSITAVTASPKRPQPGESIVVSASMLPSATATLTYRVMFGPDTTVPMRDDAGSPGGAGDGVFAATIPGAAAGQLVRYRIAASAGASSASVPPTGDSRSFEGVVVLNPAAATAKYPVLEWFMSDADYNDLLTNHRCDGVYRPAVIAWQGTVFDGAEMRVRGQSTCQDAKVKWDVVLPDGYKADLGAPFAYPLDEFALQSESTPVPRLGWELIESAGDAPLRYQTVRTQRNGSFYSVAAILEKYDNTWRAQRGYDDWELYKVDAGGLRTYATVAQLAASLDLDKKSPDDGDFTSAWQLTQVLSQPDSATKRAWLYEHLDIPQMVNFMAITVALRQWDTGGKNFYIARDAQGTGRWRLFHWDLDGILNGGSDSKGDFVTPTTSFNKLFKSLLDVPEIKQMHFRRVRTLHDQFLADNSLLNRFDALTTCCAADIALDRQAWGTPSLANRRNKVITGVQERRDQIAAHTNATEIPVSQSGTPQVVINELQYNPAPDGKAEYVELYNPSATESVDLSGWALEGVGAYAIPDGTVLLPHAYLVVVKDDVAFREAYGGARFVAGQYPGSLDDDGGTVRLLDGARVVDSVTYDDTTPWPTAPDGTGPSLELRDATADNGDPASWQSSSGNGTPAAVNSASGGTGGDTTVLPFGATWRYLATGGDQGTAWRFPGFDASTWPTGPGDLGFRNNNVTTIPATSGRTTYYFRTTFTLASGSPVTAATLDLLRDDGAVVYLNGTEVARSNLPTGTIAFTTKALADVGGADETTPITISLPAGSLVAGTNTIAVEVHQRGNKPGDLTMDAQLRVTR